MKPIYKNCSLVVVFFEIVATILISPLALTKRTICSMEDCE
jgi:hypothetical protein